MLCKSYYCLLRQLQINVKLISSYSMHHYMVVYLLDFKGMFRSHASSLHTTLFSMVLGIRALMSVRVHACVWIKQGGTFFFYISSPDLLVFASETRASVSESMHFIICTYFSSTPHKVEFSGVHELDSVTGCYTDLSLCGLISADQFVISFFFICTCCCKHALLQLPLWLQPWWQ